MVQPSLEAWARGLAVAIPLAQSNDRSNDGVVAEVLACQPQAKGTVLEALMWFRLGRFEPAHPIVENASQGLSAYVHGMLHRLEGDYWNANYWFRQARASTLVSSISEEIRGRGVRLPWRGAFEPAKLTQAVERWQGARGLERMDLGEVLQGIARIEWEAVWENALNSLS